MASNINNFFRPFTGSNTQIPSICLCQILWLPLRLPNYGKTTYMTIVNTNPNSVGSQTDFLGVQIADNRWECQVCPGKFDNFISAEWMLCQNRIACVSETGVVFGILVLESQIVGVEI
ncbi:MAG TPA: hypothetical protein VK742_12855 [Candidatus Sulfotelmatobacter sp.]|nr:hypothetical protein [Candidatus Sulfotelmatobacter sp.]